LIENLITSILLAAHTPNSPIRPTELYNEGWMLRILLKWAEDNAKKDHLLSFHKEASWFSEGMLPTTFAPRFRGDPLGEGRTNADAILGQIVLGNDGKSGLELSGSASQFVVIEAKMFSKLSSGTKNVTEFCQASRNVACMAEVLRRAEIETQSLSSLAFYVVAPRCQIDRGEFSNSVTIEKIRTETELRCEMYDGEKDKWLQDYFEPLLNAISVELLSWEDCLPQDSSIREFYDRCLTFNR
jgi:hypothetical protein